jgi:glycosyltransferase involved in cell wall biosynthesis
MRLVDNYFLLKPFIPWTLRMAIRRSQARRLKSRFSSSWPIDEAAAGVPNGWPGWPGGKRFAFVLTHDVEGRRGLERCRALAEVEMRLGFRSSFNLVPEGEYADPETLRAFLRKNRFEVGVHDLHHDGSLYRSAETFRRQAQKINQYLQSWEAVGFRSGFMFHNLKWLQDLNVLYDSSTFDTDPFEPQPDGAQTIFPFWVPGKDGKGYVELPYTLPQDSTLFLLLKEPSIDVWVRKLDWVAAQGGMVLLGTHPDYMCFDDIWGRGEFPVRYYEEFLSYVQEKYAGSYWSALPREVASFYREHVPRSPRRIHKKICMLEYNNYDTDNRVRRYAETLVKRGDQVDVIAITGGNHPLGTTVINGVTVHYIRQRTRDERSKWTYAWRLLRFLVLSSIYMTRLHRRHRFDLIHVHNVPDFLVFAAWYPKLMGSKLILDIHDIVPEFFASKFLSKTHNGYVRLLKSVEKASMAFADHVIVSNHLWHERLIARSVSREKSSVFINHVDPAQFYRHPRTRDDDKFIIVFPGGFQWHQGLDIAIEAFARVKLDIPNAELHLYGGGNIQGDLARLAKQLGLNDSVKFCGSIPYDEIAGVIANADLGIVPKRSDSFGNEAYSTKIMEFMSQGIPVVVSRTKIDTFYFDDSVVKFFESGNVEAMADAMLQVIKSPAMRDALIAKGFEYVVRHNWDHKKNDYLDLVDSLVTGTFSETEHGERAA